MYCAHCGKQNNTDSQFCAHCGKPLSATVAAAAISGSPNDHFNRADAKSEGMTFTKAISTCLSKYATFTGRASRSEYWWFFLFVVLLDWLSLIVDRSRGLSAIVNLALLLPSLAASTRRLHDTNRSGWWQLLSLTIIGIIPVFYWLAKEGDAHPNRFDR